jgi:hypothetical protein
VGRYVTEAEVRAEGATASSAKIESRIAKWEALVEKLTRNIFYVAEPGELIFNGNNMDELHFSIPLVEVTSVKINNNTVALSTLEYRAYMGKTPPADDRYNPRIKLCPTGAISPIFLTAPGLFLNGYDQKVTAKWGYVDPGTTPGTYVTPKPIKEAIIQLIILDLDSYFDRGIESLRGIASETTDGHSISYAQISQGTWSIIPAQIADILCLYRSAWKITAPNDLVFADPAYLIYGW